MILASCDGTKEETTTEGTKDETMNETTKDLPEGPAVSCGD
jgi:hypothetical protein